MGPAFWAAWDMSVDDTAAGACAAGTAAWAVAVAPMTRAPVTPETSAARFSRFAILLKTFLPYERTVNALHRRIPVLMKCCQIAAIEMADSAPENNRRGGCAAISLWDTSDGLARTALPRAADTYGLACRAAHGYRPDPAMEGDTGYRT